MHQRKLINKNVTEMYTFSPFTEVNIFLVHFLKLFQRIRNQREILRFLISFDLKKCSGHISTFFLTLKPNAQKTAQNIKKRI
jgi:hypothetical protein